VIRFFGAASGFCGSICLVLALSGWARASPPQPPPIKMILDTDMGGDIDDAWALGLAMNSPEFELVAVTISDGDTTARARVACKLLHTSDRGDVPVAVGRRTSPPEGIDYQFTWAEDFTAKRPVAEPAAQVIVDLARRFPNELTLVAVGPLQNVADALRLEPRLPKLFKRVVLMSGSIRSSAWNPAPVPEWNVVRATADAQLVYAAGFPMTTVPLDSTTYVQLKEEERERLRARATPLTRSLEALYRLWLDSPARRMTLHDQLAVAETARPGAFFARCEPLLLRVDDQGFTRIDEAKGRQATVCFEPKRDAFMNYYLEGLSSSRKKP
jgi:inosine-uridine nucleoside N-ribohydrolase